MLHSQEESNIEQGYKQINAAIQFFTTKGNIFFETIAILINIFSDYY